MATIPLENLPPEPLSACTRLRDGLLPLLGDDLVALWVYGAVVSPEPPARLGDIDTHGILARPVAPETAARIDDLHRRIDLDLGVELDGWYVLLDDARKPEPPPHILRSDLVDESWALHRAHLLSGRCAVVHGTTPQAIVQPPTWPELRYALEHEMRFVEDHLHLMEAEPFAPYAVWNCCRIAYSFETRDVVASKRESAAWALDRFPTRWHGLIRAAGRWYDRAEEPGDEGILRERTREFVAYVKDRISRTES